MEEKKLPLEEPEENRNGHRGDTEAQEVPQESREGENSILRSQIELLMRENERLLSQQQEQQQILEPGTGLESILGIEDAPPDYISHTS